MSQINITNEERLEFKKFNKTKASKLKSIEAKLSKVDNTIQENASEIKLVQEKLKRFGGIIL